MGKKKNTSIEPKPDNAVNFIMSTRPKVGDDRPKGEDAGILIKEWLNPIHIKSKTRYTKRQVIGVTILESLAKTYNILTLKRFLKEFRTAKLSEESQSSKELEAILKSRIPEPDEEGLKKIAKFIE